MFNVKPIASKMKKFISCMVLMLAALTASAMAQTKAASPPEQDIGYEQLATLSLDGMTAVAIHSQPYIVDWQTPVMVAQEASTASAQVVGAVTIATPAAEVGIGLVAYRWPGCKPESTTTDAITPTTWRTVADAYPFTTAHTDRL